MRAIRLVVAIGLLASAAVPAAAVTEPDELVSGTFVVVRPKVFRFSSLQGAFDLPDPENDPTVGGATLRVLDTAGGNDVTFLLPAANWQRLPAFRPAKPLSGYRYRGAGTPDDPCTLVTVRRRFVKAICRNVALTLPFSGDVGVVLSVAGDMKRYCALLGGATRRNTPNGLRRGNAPAPAACPVPGGVTTTSSTIATTSTSSTLVEETTTTSSTVETSSTTSSTEVEATTTTSSTEVETTTTTSTSATTSSTTVEATTTSSTAVEASTTTSSTVEEPSTTSSTVAGSTTSSSTVLETTTSSTSSSSSTSTSSSTTITSTSSTTSTTAAACCNGDGFLSFSTVNAPGDCGDILNQSGSKFADLACAGLYTGGGGNSVPLPLGVPDLGLAVTAITSCIGQTAVLGPTTSAQTGSNRNCTSLGCLFGAPLSVPNPGTPPTSVCVLNRVAADPMGSANCGTGATSVSLPLQSIIYLTGDTATDPSGTITGVQPCPLCQGGDPGTPGSGTCVGGPNNGMSCTPGTTEINAAYPTSHDCPPDPTFDIGTLPIGLSLTTGTVTWTAVPGTGGSGQLRVFSGFCRDADDTGAFEQPARHCLENGQTVNPCAGVFEACEQRNNGAFGPSGGGNRTITAIGSGSSVLGGRGAATLVSIFSIPPTFNATVDAAGDLPAPGAVAIPGTAETCPTANPCP